MSDQFDYHGRKASRHLDGTRVFQSSEDQTRQREVAGRLERSLGCEIHELGPLDPIDWYFVLDDRLTAVGELKCRSHEVDRYPDTFCSVRKWLALMMASTGLGVTGLYVVDFSDDTRLIPVNLIDASSNTVLRARRGRETYAELMIRIPVWDMIRPEEYV